MAELCRVSFECDDHAGDWVHLSAGEDSLVLCPHGLDEIFDLPRGTKKMDAVLHSRPAVNRVRVMIDAEYGDAYPYLVVVEEGFPEHRVEEDTIDVFLKPLVGRTLYLQLEYYEEDD